MKLSEEIRATIAGPGPSKCQLEHWVDAANELEGIEMRMDENTNPEWKKLLRGTSSGRKALEIIADLERQLAECQRELSRVTNEGTEYAVAYNKGYEDGLKKDAGRFTCEGTKLRIIGETLAECQRDRDVLREALTEIYEMMGTHADYKIVAKEALAATKEVGGE